MDANEILREMRERDDLKIPRVLEKIRKEHPELKGLIDVIDFAIATTDSRYKAVFILEDIAIEELAIYLKEVEGLFIPNMNTEDLYMLIRDPLIDDGNGNKISALEEAKKFIEARLEQYNGPYKTKRMWYKVLESETKDLPTHPH